MGFKGSKMRSREWGCASPGEVQGGPLKEATVSVRILEPWRVEALGLGVDAWNHRTQFIPSPELPKGFIARDTLRVGSALRLVC